MRRFHHNFDHDVFISYAHVEEQLDGWVSEFHSILAKELRSRTGRLIEIWRDPVMAPGVLWDDAMLEAARRSAVFVPILSEAWIASEACQREFRAFVESSRDNFRFGEYSRLVPAETLPVGNLPEPLQKPLSARFYEIKNGRALRFALPSTYRGDSGFERLMQDIAESIAEILRRMEEATLGAQPELGRILAHAREHVEPLIRDRCSTMKILTMSQGIDAAGIYTRVNMLEKIPGRQRRSKRELLREARRKDFDRLGLGEIKEQRVDGLDAVRRYPKLMILGKPGAGKTTFLRRLAHQCSVGSFRPELVPAYVPLREFSENTRVASIEDVLAHQWSLPDPAELQAILRTGRALILLDGLDEVANKHNDRVLQQVNEFTRTYPRSPVVMTCRIAAREYSFEQFAEVEIADFDKAQIGQFARNWFTLRGQPDKAPLFVTRLEANAPMLELASSPLLLTLLCLIFEERTDFEGDRAELYREGLEVLLRKWDATRNIERDQPYRDLSLARKQDLLSQIAHARFEKGEYFFDQDSLEREISGYFLSQSGKPVKASPEAILRAIEAQHGLLVARAHRIYSFSHLTFQEYLTAKRIFEDPNPEKWDALLTNIGDRRWREVMMLVASMVSPADDLLVRILSFLNKRVARNEAIQSYLAWVFSKSQTVHLALPAAFIRAVYWSVGFSGNPMVPASHELALSRFFGNGQAKVLDLDLARAIDPSQARLLVGEIDAARDQELAFDRDLEIAELERSVSEHQLAQMVNYQTALDARSVWVQELRACLDLGSGIAPNRWSRADARRLEEYEQGHIVMLDCLRIARVTRGCHNQIMRSILLPVGRADAS